MIKLTLLVVLPTSKLKFYPYKQKTVDTEQLDWAPGGLRLGQYAEVILDQLYYSVILH